MMLPTCQNYCPEKDCKARKAWLWSLETSRLQISAFGTERVQCELCKRIFNRDTGAKRE